MVLTIRMPTFGTRRVAWSQKWNHLSKNTGSFENISRTKLFGTKVHYKREVETWYSTRFTVLIDFFAKQNSRRIGFFFASADSTTRFWEECRSMSHVMWSFSFSYQSILVGTFSLRLKKSFIRLGTQKTVLRIVSTQDFFSRSWKSAKWHDYDELYFLPKTWRIVQTSETTALKSSGWSSFYSLKSMTPRKLSQKFELNNSSQPANKQTVLL